MSIDKDFTVRLLKEVSLPSDYSIKIIDELESEGYSEDDITLVLRTLDKIDANKINRAEAEAALAGISKGQLRDKPEKASRSLETAA